MVVGWQQAAREESLGGLAYVGGECGADVVEGVVETGSKEFNAGGCTKAEQCNHQDVLNQVLTLFVDTQTLELHVQLENSAVHLRYPPGQLIERQFPLSHTNAPAVMKRNSTIVVWADERGAKRLFAVV
jgi:hypothetical protein